jgi:hypothetical protein
MKIDPRRAPLAEAAAHQEDSTPEIEAGQGLMVHRRTTVTIERETISILVRRTVAEVAVAQNASAENVSETPEKLLPATMPDDTNGDKT